MKPISLRCESLKNPIGLDEIQPRLSWKLPSGSQGLSQTGYQILVASSTESLSKEKGDLWDTGKVQSSDSVHIVYKGKKLSSRTRALWKVRVWDQDGNASQWSEVAFWETGLSEKDWKAKWIGGIFVGGNLTSVPVPLVRKSFSISKSIKSARLYVTSLGLYECSINGERVGDLVFAPGWTDYNQRLPYQAYDVTDLVQKGKNAIGAYLGDGWYCGYLPWGGRQIYGAQPKLLAQLEIIHADDSVTRIVSDESWKTYASPILAADNYMGESYDANLEIPGWDSGKFNDEEWYKVKTFKEPERKLVGMYYPPVRRTEEISPVQDPVLVGDRWVFNIGQNITGRVRIKLKQPKGTTIIIRHAERLDSKGSLYTENLREARCTDIYTFGSDEQIVWEPRFTFHGFQYVDIKGLMSEPTRDAVTGIAIHSDMPKTGTFTCSDPLINQLQSNIQWSQRDNMLEVPTDCPQRDERLGWTGDAQVFIRTAAFNMDVSGFFTKWQQDLNDTQSKEGYIPNFIPTYKRTLKKPSLSAIDGGPAWSDAFIICPWTVYLCYGDTRILERNFDRFKKFFQSMVNDSKDCIRSHADFKGWHGYGDWLALDGSKDSFGITSKDLIGTAFFAHDAKLLSKIASIIGREKDAREYENWFQKIRSAYQKKYIQADGTVQGQTQTAYVLTLHFDLAPENLRPKMVQSLVADIKSRGNKLSTGFVGTPYLLHVLTQAGEIEIATELLFQKQWPSWLYAVTKGATTIWERWDGWTEDKGFQSKGMNSFNHYAYGAVGEWLYKTVAGLDLDPENPGYKKSILKPTPIKGLDHASAKLETSYGTLSSSWKLQGDALTCEVEVPPNTKATLYLPCSNVNSVKSKSGEVKIKEVTQDGKTTKAVIELVPGKYQFTSSYSAEAKVQAATKQAKAQLPATA